MKFESRIKKLEAKPIPFGLLQKTVDISEEEAERIYHEVMQGSGENSILTERGWVPVNELSEEQAAKAYRDYAEGKISVEGINHDQK